MRFGEDPSRLLVVILEEPQLEHIDWERTCDFSTTMIELRAGTTMNARSNAVMLTPITKPETLGFCEKLEKVRQDNDMIVSITSASNGATK
jgi:hypothetical protein